jgi:hypothetical protein
MLILLCRTTSVIVSVERVTAVVPHGVTFAIVYKFVKTPPAVCHTKPNVPVGIEIPVTVYVPNL